MGHTEVAATSGACTVVALEVAEARSERIVSERSASMPLAPFLVPSHLKNEMRVSAYEIVEGKPRYRRWHRVCQSQQKIFPLY